VRTVKKTGPSPQGDGTSLEHFIEVIPDAMVGVDSDGRIELMNTQAEKIFGYTRNELRGEPVELLVPHRFRAVHVGHRKSYSVEPRTRSMGSGLLLYGVRKDGSEFPAEISLSSIETNDGRVTFAAVRDISERAVGEREKSLHEQLNQARRLESVGQLAGGVAHDFNNILGVILNYAAFVADELPPDSSARHDIEEIQKAAERAIALTRQLLIFSRREPVKPEVLSLNELAEELENLLRRALGELVELELDLAENLWAIKVDPGQIEQVLVNLAVNARDAMPDGGRLLIETSNVELDDGYAEMHPEVEAGVYVLLSVSDTGAGMKSDVVERAFEPFFTTKAKGAGTGLGLATVYGTVSRAGGRVDLSTEPGKGTTVKIHLPAFSTEPAPKRHRIEAKTSGRGEVVLVVEDEPQVRRMAERILTKGGYTVIAAEGGAQAIGMHEGSSEPIDLLLTDVVMPGMLGTELVDRLRSSRPDLKVVFMSGYSHEVLAPGALVEEADTDFIEKPFDGEELLAKVQTLVGVCAEEGGEQDHGDRNGN
jgi:PAS domain S-box-containing protein